MNLLVVNPILYTPENNIIPEVQTIKDTMIYGMCKGFSALGHRVTLVASEEYKPVSDSKYDFEIRFFKSNIKKIFPPTLLPFSFELYKYLKNNRRAYDLVICSETFQISTLMAATVFPHKTVIWQEMTTHQKKYCKIPSKIWHNIILPLFIKKVKVVIPRSIKAKEFISRYVPVVSAEIVDHGIDLDKFRYSATKQRQIITSSQLVQRKNIDSIIKIFSKFVRMEGYGDIKLIVAGRGEKRKELELLADELGIRQKVRFVGFLPQKELNGFIRESYLFMINTRQDLNMVSIPESIVSGTPVLTNLKPASSQYVASKMLGIAKDDWDENDIKEIVDNNSKYVNNCIHYRESLSNTYAAGEIIKISGL